MIAPQQVLMGDYAMARDSRFPVHNLMQRINPRTQTPVPATILIFVVGVLLMLVLPGAALLDLITAGTLFPAVTYGMTIVLYLAVRRRLDNKEGAFDLGRFELPVAIAALVWSAIAIFVLVAPATATVPLVIVAGLLAVGGTYFAYLFVSHRDVLETEPGELDVFNH